jgi:hypothetical protein
MNIRFAKFNTDAEITTETPDITTVECRNTYDMQRILTRKGTQR